jgi:hypothetical protein
VDVKGSVEGRSSAWKLPADGAEGMRVADRRSREPDGSDISGHGIGRSQRCMETGAAREMTWPRRSERAGSKLECEGKRRLRCRGWEVERRGEG